MKPWDGKSRLTPEEAQAEMDRVDALLKSRGVKTEAQHFNDLVKDFAPNPSRDTLLLREIESARSGQSRMPDDDRWGDGFVEGLERAFEVLFGRKP